MAFFVLSRCFLEFYVDVEAFDIELGQTIFVFLIGVFKTVLNNFCERIIGKIHNKFT